MSTSCQLGNATQGCGPRSGATPCGAPPLLTGGLNPQKELINISCDWLSLSLSSEDAKRLYKTTGKSRVSEQAYFKGFAQHEMRSAFSGHCDRHWGPRTASKQHGTNFELWNFRGKSASYAQTHCSLAEIPEAQATRLDVAFDFRCSEDLAPLTVRDWWKPHWAKERLIPGISGQGELKSHTAYIGCKTSERRIRIYRKDIEDKIYVREPTIRIELICKKRRAASLYPIWYKDETIGFRTASEHVFEMTGFRPLPEKGKIPRLEKEPVTTVAQKLAALVNQYGTILSVAYSEGIDLNILLQVRFPKVSSSTQKRHRLLIREARETGEKEIIRQASEIIRNS